MKKLRQILRARDLDLILGDLALRRSRPSLWQDNRRVWAPELFEGFSGSVEITEAHSMVKNLVQSRIAQVHPIQTSDRVTAQYCIWHPDSGINPHRDERYRWAATLYLNSLWLAEYGGLFLTGAEAIVPEMGTLIINDQQELHCVSRIRACAPERITLQIWAV